MELLKQNLKDNIGKAYYLKWEDYCKNKNEFWGLLDVLCFELKLNYKVSLVGNQILLCTQNEKNE